MSKIWKRVNIWIAFLNNPCWEHHASKDSLGELGLELVFGGSAFTLELVGGKLVFGNLVLTDPQLGRGCDFKKASCHNSKEGLIQQ